MKRLMKGLVSILVLAELAVLLNFVPVKFAVKIDEVKKGLKVGRYICVTESKYVLDTGWIAKTSLNSHLDEDLCVRVSGNGPNNSLSEKTFDFKWFEIGNRFLLMGEAERFEEDEKTNNLYVNLDVEKWKIVYPIKRASFRQYFTPKYYLTVYDYDWVKIIKSLW